MMRFAVMSALMAVLLCSCGRRTAVNEDTVSDMTGTGTRYAGYFDLTEDGSVVTLSPYGEQRDTFRFDRPVRRVVCMSSSDVAAMALIGADSLVCGVSGLRYISNENLRCRGVCDVGYDAMTDYEAIMMLDPDLVVAYCIGAVRPPYLEKLLSLGVPVMVLYEHLEHHPLARAEYVRLFGTITGRREVADSCFAVVCHRYDSLANAVVAAGRDRVEVLVNSLYGDKWYVPGADNYMSRLVRDAGGNVVGAAAGESASRAVGVEDAYRLSLKADLWICPGNSSSMDQLLSSHRLYPVFGPVAGGRPIYNNIRLSNGCGGNDFYESGAMRPDLILEDLIAIFSGEDRPLHYFIRLQ